MRRFLLQRLILGAITLFLLTVGTFGLSRLVPGGPIATRLSDLDRPVKLSEKDEAELAALLELDQPLATQYSSWLRRVVTLDFGRSLDTAREPVRTKLGRALRQSVLLQAAALAVVYGIGTSLGVWSALRRGRTRAAILDQLLFLAYAMPHFLLATLLMLVFCTGHPWSFLPLFGLHDLDAHTFTTAAWWADFARHLALPVVCLSLAPLAVLSRYARAGLLEVLGQDHLRTARAKGLAESVVIRRHALVLGLVPVVTLAANLLPALLGGSVIVETLFSIPGMGKLTFDSILGGDYPTLMAITVLVGVATFVGHLVVDLVYRWLDPRVDLGALP